MSLKPINIIQAAEADIARKRTNSSPPYEQYAFYRKHVRQAKSVRQLLLMALMSPPIKMVVPKGEDTEVPRLDTVKKNTKLIYGNAGLLLEAIKEHRHGASQTRAPREAQSDAKADQGVAAGGADGYGG